MVFAFALLCPTSAITAKFYHNPIYVYTIDLSNCHLYFQGAETNVAICAEGIGLIWGQDLVVEKSAIDGPKIDQMELTAILNDRRMTPRNTFLTSRALGEIDIWLIVGSFIRPSDDNATLFAHVIRLIELRLRN